MINKSNISMYGLIVCIALTIGCVSVEEQRQKTANYCNKLGLKYGTSKFSDCLSRQNRYIGTSEQCLRDSRFGPSNNFGTCMDRRLR